MRKTEQLWQMIMSDLQQIEFFQPQEFCPYLEIDHFDIYEQDKKKKIAYNGMYRYEKIFTDLFEKDTIDKADKDWLFDVMIHVLLLLEFRNGISKKEYEIRKKIQRIKLGMYGQKAKKQINLLDAKSQYIVGNYMERQERIGASVTLFGEVCRWLIADGVLYKNSIDSKKLILCCNENVLKNPEINAKIELLKQMFLPLEYEVCVYADETLGIIGENITMQADKMVMF